jgi:hypothetical protein
MTSNKPNPKPASFSERSPYERIPSSAEGEFGFRDAQLADLGAKTFSESRRTNEGVATIKSQKPRTGASSPTSARIYDNSAGSKPPAR